MANKIKKEYVSRAERAGINLSVGRVHRRMRGDQRLKRISSKSPVYLAAVLEYLMAEILELAGNAATNNSRKRITPQHIMLAIKNDEELNELLSNVIIAGGGVKPHIEEFLMKKKKNQQASEEKTSKE